MEPITGIGKRLATCGTGRARARPPPQRLRIWCQQPQGPALPLAALLAGLAAGPGDWARPHSARRARARPGDTPLLGSQEKLLQLETYTPESVARPAPFASRSARRALLTPQVNPGSLYRCSEGALKSSLWGDARRKAA